VAVEFTDYYKVLNINPSADTRAIKSAYRRLVRRYHPDVAQGKAAAKRFLLIREAYEVLCDPEKRCEYDRLISKPILQSSLEHKRSAAVGRKTVGRVESSAGSRAFRLVIDALGVLRLDIGVSVGGLSPEIRSRPRRSTQGRKRNQE